jgi:hypothetical protein
VAMQTRQELLSTTTIRQPVHIDKRHHRRAYETIAPFPERTTQ